jgi:hypothetical protein
MFPSYYAPRRTGHVVGTHSLAFPAYRAGAVVFRQRATLDG